MIETLYDFIQERTKTLFNELAEEFIKKYPDITDPVKNKEDISGIIQIIFSQRSFQHDCRPKHHYIVPKPDITSGSY